MRLFLLLALTACDPDAGFSVQDTPPPPPVGEAAISPLDLDLIDAVFDTPLVGAVTVENVGTHPLRLRSATINGGEGVITTDTQANSDRRIEDGASYEILVVCRYREEPMTPVEATLIVQTNDPEAGQTDIPVSCSPASTDEDDERHADSGA